MANTTRSFSNMLNEYLPESLLFTEVKKRVWAFQNIEIDSSWLGGDIIIPFLGAVASSMSFGSLTADTDVAEEVSVRGKISGYKELWGTMIFNETDLQQHGKLSEQNFLKIMPSAIERHVELMKGIASQNFLTGAYTAKLTADGDASGNITVAQPDRFQIGQKVSVDDDNSSPASGYVRTVILDTGVITIYDARSGGAVVDLSGYTVAQNAKVYQVGQQADGFSSLRNQLLSAANGGDSTLLTQTKTAYPYLQAINISGSDITAANILAKIFDAYVKVRRIGSGMPNKVVMSYKNFGNAVKAVQTEKGAFHVKPGSQSASMYGWDEIEVGGFAGSLKLVAVQEMDDDIIFILDTRTLRFYTNGGVKRREGPGGNQFYEKRATTGYSYVVDHCLYGEFACIEPSKNGVLHSISYT
jgi:hypothetical protein